MSDASSAATVAPAEPTPSAATPAAVPVSEAALSPQAAPGAGASPEPTPSPAPAPVAEPQLIEPELPTAAEPDAVIAAAHTPGLLSVEEPKPAEKPAEPVAESTAEVVQLRPPEAPAPEPLSYADHPLQLPEDFAFEETRLGEYDAILGQHRLPPEARQQLADLYASDAKAVMEQVRRDQYETWTRTREGWREDCAADQQFGGARFETSRAAAIRMIEFAVPESERAEFNLFLAATGAADHPQFFRFLNHLAQRLDAPAQPPSNIRPAPPQTERRPTRLREFYNHSRSA